LVYGFRIKALNLTDHPAENKLYIEGTIIGLNSTGRRIPCASIFSGCYRKSVQFEWLKQQPCISHGSGGQRVQFKVSAKKVLWGLLPGSEEAVFSLLLT
jgi:hypothetical protein